MYEELTLGVLCTYLAGLLLFGLWMSRKVHDPDAFFLANRKLGTWPLTATITATVVGGSATIATGALIYQQGLPGLWLDIGGALGLIILGLTIARSVRKTGLVTLPEIIEYLFDTRVRYAAALLIVFIQIAWVSLLLQGAQAVLAVLLPFDPVLLLVLIALVFVIYTIVGGQIAVVATDIIQFLVMIIGLCAIAVPLLLLEVWSEIPTISADLLSFPVNASLGILPVLSFFFMMLMPHIVGPDIYSKILSAKDEKTARKAAIFSGFWKFMFAGSVGIMAIAAIILFPGLENPSLALPTVMTTLHPALAGILLAAFLSVMLSSADSVLLSGSTIISVDLTRRRTIQDSRLAIIFIAAAALILALYLQDIINTLKLAYTVFTAGLTLPVIFGFYKEKTKVTSKGAFFSLLFGGGSSLVWLGLNSPYIDAVLIGMIVSLIPLLLFRKKIK